MSTQAMTPATGDVPRDTWGTRLLIARAQRGLTQQAAAELCGVTRPAWSTWEDRGVIPRNQVAVTRRIAEGLGYDIGWLMWGGPLAADGPDGDGGGLPRLDSNQRKSDYTSDSHAIDMAEERERRRNARGSRRWNPFNPRPSHPSQIPAAA